MTEQEKDLLRRIPSMWAEATSMMKLLSYLQNEGKGSFNSEIDKWLDRIAFLDRLEKELEKKKINHQPFIMRGFKT
jgi:hypothetical protein